MQIRAAVLHEMGAATPYAESRPLKIETLELDPPGEGELLIQVKAAGLCHSDLSVINGNRPRPTPMALGHEAAGVVKQIGPGRSRFEVGDHVVLVFVPQLRPLRTLRGRAGRPCANRPPPPMSVAL